MFSHPKILFLVSLLFCFNPYLPFKFLFFYHSSLFAFYAGFILIFSQALKILQALTVVIMLVCRRLLTLRLPGKAAV